MTPPARRSVVTGGAGFIGSHVVERLVSRGDTVLVVDDLSRGRTDGVAPGAELVVADVASPEAAAAISSFQPDVVIHCAAQPSVPGLFRDPLGDARSNILGTINVLLASPDRASTRFVYVTTGGALFGGEMERPWREDDLPEPISPYGISKLAAERYVGTLAGSRIVVSLRLANVYGPRQGAGGEAGVVSAFIARMIDGESITIDGDGEQSRDLVYVGDVVEAIEAGIDRGVDGVFHIGTGRGTSVNELFATLAAVIGYERSATHGPRRPGDIRHSALDPSKARRDLRWSPSTSLAAGLDRTVASRRRGGAP